MIISHKTLKLLLAVTILLLAFYFRTPVFIGWGDAMFWLIIIIGFLLIFSEIRFSRRSYRRQKRGFSFLILAIAWLSLSSATASQVKFLLSQRSTPKPQPTPIEIVATPTYKVEPEVEPKAEEKPEEKPEQLGYHFIIGYRSFNEVKTLVAQKGIAGVFITDKNVRYKSKQQIKKEIETLQEIRRSQGLPPLWVAADQEGGMVSRLSPPLTKLPSLARIVDDDRDLEQQKEKIIEYATTQAKELSEIGVNLNFSPVVDLNKGIRNPSDRHSKIYRRAISDDKEVVAKVALWYCQTLEKYGVRCTIKHFPGLGRVSADTHVAEAYLRTSVDELINDDWVPFREVMKNSQAFTMLGHAKLAALDAENAVSFSKKVVNDLIRENWQHDGILLTDDFGMQAVYGSKDGVGNAAVKAMNAGVDLILLSSYDRRLYTKAINALQEAEKTGKIDREIIARSNRRLQNISPIAQSSPSQEIDLPKD